MKSFHFLTIILMKFIIFVHSANIRKEEPPMEITVNYVTPLRDLTEQTKYMEEHLNYVRNFKQMDWKLKDDIETLKMMLNQQTTQIEKMNSIVNTNYAAARKLLYDKNNK